jgi:GcrA cell cycle regulator
MSWTEERVELLKQYWADGMSATQIAKQLGGVTRNAVIGKVHRLGLSKRTPGETPAEEQPAPAATAESAEAPAAQAPSDAAPDPEPEPAPEPAATAAANGAEAAPNGAAAEEAPAPPARPAEAERRDPSQPRPPGPPTQAEEEARVSLAEIEKMARKLDLLELTERTCKWPIGDPAEEGFHFCGLPTALGKPYCEHHIEIAFQPVSSRRDRNRGAR